MNDELLIEATQLNQITQDDDNSLLIDISTPETYLKHHIPGAVFFEFKNLVSGIKPAPGQLPEIEPLLAAFAQTGITTDKTIIAYDDEGGGKASRLIWTLDTLGFKKLRLINGGLHAWAQANLGLESSTNDPIAATTESLQFDLTKIADMAYILAHLDDPQVVIWDTRTVDEYTGVKARAARNGHIPGAVNLNWQDTIDMQNGLRYKPKEQLVDMLTTKGITTDKTIVPHCHTHHRSAHSSILLKYLGYEHVKAYPGSWSEWGNSAQTPIEQ